MLVSSEMSGAAWGGVGRREQMDQNSVCGGQGLRDMLTITGRRQFHYLDLHFRREDPEWTYSSGPLHLKNATWCV